MRMRIVVFLALVAFVVTVVKVRDLSELFFAGVLTAVILAGFYALMWLYGMVPPGP